MQGDEEADWEMDLLNDDDENERWVRCIYPGVTSFAILYLSVVSCMLCSQARVLHCCCGIIRHLLKI